MMNSAHIHAIWSTLLKKCLYDTNVTCPLNGETYNTKNFYLSLSKWILCSSCLCHPILILQPYGQGKYVFDTGCEQHGEYHQAEQDRAEGKWGELASTTVLRWIPKCITGLTPWTPAKDTSGGEKETASAEEGAENWAVWSAHNPHFLTYV